MKTMRLLVVIGFVAIHTARAQGENRTDPLDDILRILEWQSVWEPDDGAVKALAEKGRADFLVFWARDDGLPRAGFCSKAIGLCRAYTDPYWAPDHFSMQLRANESPSSGLSRIFAEDLAKFIANPLMGLRPSVPRTLASYEVASMRADSVKLKDRYKSRRNGIAKGVDLVALSRVLRCPCGKSRNNTKLLVPYFDQSDPFVYIVRECLCQCEGCSRGIAVVRWRDGRWLFSARDLITETGLVRRISEKFSGVPTVRVDPN